MKRIIFHHKGIEQSPLKDAIIIDNTKSDLDHRLWSELAGYKLLYDKITTEKDENGMALWNDFDFISLNHYRRIMDTDICDRIAIPVPFALPEPVFAQYSIFHNLDDLKTSGDALKAKYPHLVPMYEQVLNSNTLIPYTIGIMTVSQFKDYWSFLYTVLSEVLNIMKISTYEEMLEHVKNNTGYIGEKKDQRPEYQARVLSFLAERLSTLYWFAISKQVPVFPARVKLLEEGQKI